MNSNAGTFDTPEIFLLIGRPTGHSPTPAIWNAVFRAAGRAWRSEACDVLESELPLIFAAIRTGALPGAFVTMPYKSQAARAADQCDEHVRRAGAANLLLHREGELAAMNTDAAAVHRLVDGQHFAHGVILGSGGAARAAMSGLLGRCGWLTVTSLDVPGAEDLASRAEGGFRTVAIAEWKDRGSVASRADLIVNATPLGMAGLQTESPLPPGSIGARTWVYDFVYRPDGTRTPLQSAAVGAGAQVSDGLAHLESQAILALPALNLDAALADLISRQARATLSCVPLRWTQP